MHITYIHTLYHCRKAICACHRLKSNILLCCSTEFPCKDKTNSYIYAVCMNPILNQSSVLQCFECGNTAEQLTISIYLRVPQIIIILKHFGYLNCMYNTINSNNIGLQTQLLQTQLASYYLSLVIIQRLPEILP